MNLEGDDRLSSLPEDLIYKILSYAGIKRAIELSTLASRWRFLWTSMPFLDFSSKDISTLSNFSLFVANVLSRHNNLVQVFSIKLRFSGDVSQVFVKRIMDYAFSHNIKRLDVACLLANRTAEFPMSLFSSKTLKHLSLKREFIVRSGKRSPIAYDLYIMSTWELPALTTLCLHEITLRDDKTGKHSGVFSKCVNLKTLVLKGCIFIGSNDLSICHPLLANLTIHDVHVHGNKNIFTVVAPQLKNLSIHNFGELGYLVSAPGSPQEYRGSYYLLRLSTQGSHSLEKVDLCVSGAHASDAPLIINLFHQLLQSVKFLQLNLEIAERLVELIPNQPSPFGNLKSLKIHPEKEPSGVQVLGMSTQVKSYLLGAAFTIKIKAMNDALLARKLMRSLWRLLKQEKIETDTNGTRMKQLKRQWEGLMENYREDDREELENFMQMTRIDSCLEDMSVQLEKGKEVTRDIVSSLQEIKDVMIKLPSSKRAEMQACFSSLYAEADTVVNKIIDRVTLKRSHVSACFQEIVGMSAEVKSYLLDSSSGATFTMVTREEVKAMNDAQLAQKLMTSLWRLLKQEKIETDGNENCHEDDRAEVENEMQMARIDSFWEDMSVQLEKGKEVTRDIVSSLQEIKDVMIKLPSSKRAEMQACFSSLCAEADTVVNKIIDRVTLKRSHVSACFQEIASKLQPSS